MKFSPLLTVGSSTVSDNKPLTADLLLRGTKGGAFLVDEKGRLLLKSDYRIPAFLDVDAVTSGSYPNSYENNRTVAVTSTYDGGWTTSEEIQQQFYPTGDVSITNATRRDGITNTPMVLPDAEEDRPSAESVLKQYFAAYKRAREIVSEIFATQEVAAPEGETLVVKRYLYINGCGHIRILSSYCARVWFTSLGEINWPNTGGGGFLEVRGGHFFYVGRKLGLTDTVELSLTASWSFYSQTYGGGTEAREALEALTGAIVAANTVKIRLHYYCFGTWRSWIDGAAGVFVESADFVGDVVLEFPMDASLSSTIKAALKIPAGSYVFFWIENVSDFFTDTPLETGLGESNSDLMVFAPDFGRVDFFMDFSSVRVLSTEEGSE